MISDTKKIMIIEDDPITRSELTLILENEGYQILPVTDFTDILSQFIALNSQARVPERPCELHNHGVQPSGLFHPAPREAACDLVLLDLGLPGKDGFTICMEIRRISQVPILFLTSRDSALDELQALNLGGDDYIAKPYNIPLLLAHIKALLRRTSGTQEPDILEAGGLSVCLSRGTASAGDKSAELTRNELRILVHLMRHPGEIVSRADLIDALWDDHVYIDDNTLSVNMTRLRGKLAELGLPDYIKTRRGMGYQAAPVLPV